MARKFIRAFMVAALCLHGGAAVAAADYKIVTANEKGTYFAIGVDLAKFVAPDATITLEVLPTAGSAAHLQHPPFHPPVIFPPPPAHVYPAFIHPAAPRLYPPPPANMHY